MNVHLINHMHYTQGHPGQYLITTKGLRTILLYEMIYCITGKFGGELKFEFGNNSAKNSVYYI